MSIRNLAGLLEPRSIAVIGAPTGVLQLQLVSNLQASDTEKRPLHQCSSLPWPAADLAVILDSALAIPEALHEFAKTGGRALLWAADAPVSDEVLSACRPARIRILGPRTCGIASPGAGFNATWLAQTPLPGSVALIAQSRSIAATVMDFAQGRQLGFSWLAVTGAERDVDVADLLDYAALDPSTRAVVLDLGHIGEARKFMSAARAVARIKPVVVLQSPGAGAQLPDPVRSAAFARAGLVECADLEALFDALAALERLPVLKSYRIAIAGNGAGLCALGSSALARHGLEPARLSQSTCDELLRLNPQTRFSSRTVDLGEMPGATIAVALRHALADPGVDLLLLVHGPGTQCPQRELAEALSHAKLGGRLLAVWPGLELAATARAISAAAGIATFATADQAARAVRFRMRHAINHQLLTQTPEPDAGDEPNSAQCAELLHGYEAAGTLEVPADASMAVLENYAVATPGDADTVNEIYRVTLSCNAELGMHIDLQATTANEPRPRACALPPLDSVLATRLLLEAGVSATSQQEALAPNLIRLARLAVEQPLICAAQLELGITRNGSAAIVLPGASLWVNTPPTERRRLALAPYPSDLGHVTQLGQDSSYLVRAIRPSDEPALIELLHALNPEEVRYRFFIHLRHFSHAMAARMTQIDYDRELALVAFDVEKPEALIGTVTLIADADGSEAEFAILVHHAHAGRGLGRHLMTCMLEYAAAKGVSRVIGHVLSDNRSMLALARRLGFAIKSDPLDPGCRMVEMRVAAKSAAGDADHRRVDTGQRSGTGPDSS